MTAYAGYGMAFDEEQSKKISESILDDAYRITECQEWFDDQFRGGMRIFEEVPFQIVLAGQFWCILASESVDSTRTVVHMEVDTTKFYGALFAIHQFPLMRVLNRADVSWVVPHWLLLEGTL